MAAKASKREGKSKAKYVSRGEVMNEIWDEHLRDLERTDRKRKTRRITPERKKRR